MTNLEEQENEILVLTSILDSENVTCYKIISEENSVEQNAGRFVIDVDFDDPLRIEVKLKDASKHADILYLPPIYCSFVLPLNYPSESGPEIDIVSIWISVATASRLKQKFEEIRLENENLPILYLFYQCVKDELYDLIENPLNLNSLKPAKPRRTSLLTQACCDSSPAVLVEPEHHNNRIAAHYAPEQLFEVLVDYNRLRKRKMFEKNVFSCEICCVDNYGSDCVQFTPCEHTFCRSCSRDFFNLHIKEGTFELLKCMASKCETIATPQLIRDVVDEDVYERYDRMTFTRSLDMMQDVVECPRPSCRSFVVLDADDPHADPRLGWCLVCSFAFCTLCRKVYHGVAPCAITGNDVSKVVDEYLEGDDEVKKLLDERYGKMTIRKLIDDASSMKWQTENCQGCPACRSPIEKKDGCNKMWCSKCGCYFCWLCLKVLPKDNPYNHFNDPKSTCFNALFRGVAHVNDDDEDLSDDDGW